MRLAPLALLPESLVGYTSYPALIDVVIDRLGADGAIQSLFFHLIGHYFGRFPVFNDVQPNERFRRRVRHQFHRRPLGGRILVMDILRPVCVIDRRAGQIRV